jgi:hypothetical protein
MKRALFIGLLALALPLAAFANSTTYTDFIVIDNGTLSGIGSGSGLSVGSASIGLVNGFGGGGLVLGSLGTLSFSTGALLSSAGNTETFAGGGSFTITGSGTNSIPGGVIFSGTFSAPVTLEEVAMGTNHPYYMLLCEGSCSVNGTWLNTGKTVSGSFVLQTNPGTSGIGFAYFSLQSPSAVPEPGTLSMLGTGLLGLGVLVRRKLKA